MRLAVALSFLLLLQMPAFAAGSVGILGYHTFIDGKISRYDFSLSELREQITYFKERGYTFVTFSDIVEGKVSGTKNILITIDDGNRSVYRAYTEVLKPMGIRPLLALFVSVLGRKKSALTWKQVKELSRDGCEIAAHGYYHRKMNRRLYRRDRNAYLNEIFKTKSVLEKKLGVPIRVFVYPYGLYIKEVFGHLREAGYSYAMTIRGRTARLPLSEYAHPYEVPRYMITRRSRKAAFARIVRSAPADRRLASVTKHQKPARSQDAAVKTVEEPVKKIERIVRERRVAVEKPVARSRIRKEKPALVAANPPEHVIAVKSEDNRRDSVRKTQPEQPRLLKNRWFFSSDTTIRDEQWWRYRKGDTVHYRVQRNEHSGDRVSEKRSEKKNAASKRADRRSPEDERTVLNSARRDFSSLPVKNVDSRDTPVTDASQRKHRENRYRDRVSPEGKVKDDGKELMKHSVKRYRGLLRMMKEKTDSLFK